MKCEYEDCELDVESGCVEIVIGRIKSMSSDDGVPSGYEESEAVELCKWHGEHAVGTLERFLNRRLAYFRGEKK